MIFIVEETDGLSQDAFEVLLCGLSVMKYNKCKGT